MVVLLGLLAFHVKAHVSALLGLVSALLVATLIYRMPASLAGMAAVHGAFYGLLPIGWIVLNAIFIYDITVKSGDFEVVKHSIAALASDPSLRENMGRKGRIRARELFSIGNYCCTITAAYDAV